MAHEQDHPDNASATTGAAAQAPATRRVTVKLSAYTRVEYIETLEVPADLSDDEAVQLAEQRYKFVDGGSYTEDAEYWERGDQEVTPAVDGLAVSGVAVRSDDGSFIVRGLPEKLACAEHWEHLGRDGTLVTRWVYDIEKRVLKAAQVRRFDGVTQRWDWMLEDVVELTKSIRDNLDLSPPEDLEIEMLQHPPAWAIPAFKMDDRLDANEEIARQLRAMNTQPPGAAPESTEDPSPRERQRG